MRPLRVSLAIVLVAAVFVALWAAIVRMPGRSYHGPLAPLSSAEEEAKARLDRDVRALADEIGERSVWNPAGLERAARHVEETLEGLGYEVNAHRYLSHGQEVRNVEATLRGGDRSEEIVLVGAHYDSVQGTVGANDNASGVAAMLEIARRLAEGGLPRTLRFVAFVNEEPPHFNVDEMGSRFYAELAAARDDRIVAMFSLETIGCYFDEPGTQHYPFPFNLFYPSEGNFIGFIGNVGSGRLVRRAIDIFRRHARFPSEGVAAPSWIPGVSWSDHASFWRQGIRAIMITDTAIYRDPRYHTAQDRAEHVDTARMARVVDGLVEVVRAIAEEGV